MKVVYAIAFLAVMNAVLAMRTEVEMKQAFQDFTTKFNKEYSSAEERQNRFEIFKQSVQYIDAHNAKQLSYTNIQSFHVISCIP